MSVWDVVVVGGGISGLAFAERAARAGQRTLLLEARDRVGGCLYTAHTESGFWIELGAHTAYNSYAGFIDLIESAGPADAITARAKQPFRLWRDGEMKAIGGALAKLPLVMGVLSMPFRRKAGRSVREFYGGIVGRRNYDAVVSRLLSAVPSQRVDGFPADMLFKKRPRRKDLPRSFTLAGGLQTLAEGIRSVPGLTVRTGQPARRVSPEGDGFRVDLAEGEPVVATRCAVAVPPNVAARLLREGFPDVAAPLDSIAVAEIISVGVVVKREAVADLEPLAGIVPGEDDIFWSVVSRDVVPDPELRGFTFHFHPNSEAAERTTRIRDILGVAGDALIDRFEARSLLPSPVLGHQVIVDGIERALQGSTLALTGNYFTGLALEDCVARSRAEWNRVAPS